MKARIGWSLVLVALGLLAMLVGAIDPLEGSFLILPGSGVVALGAWLGASRYRTLLSWAFLLTAIGVGAMAILSALGGIGGPAGHSLWWGVFLLPYALGWILGVGGAVLSLIESCKQRGAPVA